MNTKKGLSRAESGGFTLLELLMVVAIIAILATIVMVALGDARKRGNDGGVQENLRNANAQAEIFWNTNTANPNTYTGVCTATVASSGALGIGSFVSAAAKDGGLGSVTPDGTNGTLTTATCHDSAATWAAEVPLLSKGANQMWCVDSTGKSKQESTTIGAGTACN